MIILILFSLLLLVTNIYCFITKRYLYLFVPCMLFLPAYYGIEINDTLPLITVTRIMFVVFYVYAFLNRKKNILLKRIHYNQIPRSAYYLSGYFFLRILSNLRYITTYSQSAKTILSITFEQLLLIIAIYLLSPTKSEIITLIKVVVWTSSILFLIGILESLTFVRPFDLLYTVSRPIFNQHYVRFGLLRATTTLSMPVYYGNMCILVLPLILFVYEASKSKRYLISVGLCLLAAIHSGSRADLIFLIPILVFYSVYILQTKKRRFLFIKNALIVMITLLTFISILSLFSPNYKYYYTGTAKSVLNEFGFDYDLDAGAPIQTSGFDSKAIKGDSKGSTSRIAQFSGIVYVSKINPFFGLGSGAQTRGDIKYYVNKKWRTCYTYDVGYVESFCDEGIIGSLGFIFLAIALFSAYYKLTSLPSYRPLLLLPFCYTLSLLCTANMYYFLMLITILSMSLLRANSYPPNNLA